MGKIVTKKEFQIIKEQLKAEGKKTVLCHGVFDLVHPGHIIHFEQAKKMGDVLVVSVTSEKFVRKGPDRPYFNDEMRMQFLEAIRYIDYVMLSEGYTVDDIVEAVEPDLYVKGEEYRNPEDDVTGGISKEQKLVEEHGGKIRFTSGLVFSSTKLINTALSGLTDDVRRYMESFRMLYSMNDIREYADKISRLNILVIGDTIIDKYTYCDIQGMMSKDMGYSARLKHSEEYFGGAVAIARHLVTYAKDVTLMSVIGNEGAIRHRMFDALAETMRLRLVYSDAVPTIIKHRYLTRDEKREEYQKIFAVNNIPVKLGYEEEVRRKFLNQIREKIRSYDVVYLCDFGHGLVDEDVMELVQKEARYLVLNCQTNSSNKGMNIITKYKRADAFALDQQELKLAYPSYTLDEKSRLAKLCSHLGGTGWLTRGSKGAYGMQRGGMHKCPAFTLVVKDTIGAGDAFFATAGAFAAAGAPAEIGTFMGNISGALDANIIGNKEVVNKVDALKFASTLLNV